jgi:hypothetical protein
MAAYNLTESQILEPFYILWITLTAFSVSFGIQRRRRGYEEEAQDHEMTQSGTAVDAFV